jgi:hypothetical protein
MGMALPSARSCLLSTNMQHVLDMCSGNAILVIGVGLLGPIKPPSDNLHKLVRSRRSESVGVRPRPELMRYCIGIG